MAKIKMAYEEYKVQKATGHINLNTLEAKYGISPSSLSQHFRKFDAAALLEQSQRGAGQAPTTPDLGTAIVRETVEQQRQKALEGEAKDVIDDALAIGTIIVTRYRPHLEAFIAQGKSPEDMAIEIMSWYEQKLTTEGVAKKKDMDILLLQERIEEISKYAKPNYVFETKAHLLRQFLQDVMRARAFGIQINPKRAVEFYSRRLDYYQSQAELLFSPEVEVIA